MYRRPRGRTPHGKKWDETIGTWVVDTPIHKANSTIKEKNFVCDNCNMKFGNQAWLTRHVCRADDAVSTTSTTSTDLSDIGIGYTTKEKMKQRYAFALECAEAAEKFPDNKHILYLESAGGGATEALRREGFHPEQLHPCNDLIKRDGHEDDLECLNELRQKYPGIQCEEGDIIEVAKGRNWLGIWYDTTATWHCGGEWKMAAMPAFDNAVVIAVNLCGRGIKGVTCKGLADKLGELLKNEKGTVSSEPTAYKGVGGWTNMAFGVATFPPPKLIMNAEAYVYASLHVPRDYFDAMAKANKWPTDWHDDYHTKLVTSVDGQVHSKFAAVVSGTSLDGSRLLVTFYNKEGKPFEEPDEWWSPTPDEVEPFRMDWFKSSCL